MAVIDAAKSSSHIGPRFYTAWTRSCQPGDWRERRVSGSKVTANIDQSRSLITYEALFGVHRMSGECAPCVAERV
jgi:hypothetical protein